MHIQLGEASVPEVRTKTIEPPTLVVRAPGWTSRHEIRALSVSRASVRGGRLPEPGSCVNVTLELPLYPPFVVRARVTEWGLFFLHESDVTEDHIQAALLSELERNDAKRLRSMD